LKAAFFASYRRWILCGLIALAGQEGFCQIQSVTFSGSQATDGWVIDFISYPQTTFGTFPGTKTWQQAMIANVPGSQGGALTKVTNGLGGGPYPGDHLYFGGYSTNTNTFGGTIKLSVSPLASVKKIVLQVQITEAYGLDFHQPSGSPELLINSNAANLSPSITRTQHEWIDTVAYTGAPEDLYLNTYRYEWDVASVLQVISSIEIQMSVVQHGQIFALQVDQGGPATTVIAPPILKIVSVGPVIYQNGESSVEVTFEGASGQNYVLERNEGLGSSGWSSDSQAVSTGTGTFTYTLRATGDRRTAWQRQLFFRARRP
jgi:hypothetical protein